MQRLWRIQPPKSNTFDPPHLTNKSQSEYIDQLSKLIKIFKRKQQIYIRLLQHSNNQTPIDNLTLKNQHQRNLSEESNLIETLLEYKHQAYTTSKTYLYSIFMRINQVIEHSRHKSCIYGAKQEKIYIQHKNKMLQCYQNYTYFKKYDVLSMLKLATSLQNERICRFIPKKKSIIKLPPTLDNQIKINQRMKSLQSSQIYYKKQLVSITTITNNIDTLLSKKLETTKQASQKKKKQKPVNLNKLYKMLQIRPMSIEDYIEDRRQIERDMIQRNQKAIQERKKWEKMYLAYQNSSRNFRSKVITCLSIKDMTKDRESNQEKGKQSNKDKNNIINHDDLVSTDPQESLDNQDYSENNK